MEKILSAELILISDNRHMSLPKGPNPNDTVFPFAGSQFPLNFKSITVIPLSKDTGKVLVQWELIPTTINLSDFEFYIDRGDTVDQIPAFQHVTIDGVPWVSRHTSTSTESVNMKQIAGPISGLDFYEFTDFTPLLRNLYKTYYYRVRLRRISTQEEIGSAPITWKGDLDLEALYVIDEHNFMLEDATGVPILVYKRRRSGIECTQCFDKIQNKRISSHCMRCFGTNWEGGFHNPIDAYLDISPPMKQAIIEDWGETQPTETDVLLSNYPLVSNGDVLRELRSNRMWRVIRTRSWEKLRVPMLQTIRVKEINPGDVEYRIPIDVDFLKKKISEFETYKKRREF